jgi:hypothetical protein
MVFVPAVSPAASLISTSSERSSLASIKSFVEVSSASTKSSVDSFNFL